MDVDFYSSASNVFYVAEFINKQEPKTAKKIMSQLDLIAKYGHQAFRSLNIKKMSGTDFWEIKITFNKLAYRIFFVIRKNTIWLLHAFTKKSNKTLLKHINMTNQRIIDLDNRI